ncbi:MAG: Endo,4-beta-xylanase precursor [Labilithrix sp.]|nr:Endo,4-beta-xylanase precursor [Labilithrix sp.]
MLTASIGAAACGDASTSLRDARIVLGSPDPSGGGSDAWDAGVPFDATLDSGSRADVATGTPGNEPMSPVPSVDPPAPDASDASDAAHASDLSPPFVFRDLNHVLATGEDLSLGVFGTPVLSTVPVYSNRTFVTGVMSGDTNLTAFIPLVEGDVVPGTLIAVETMSTSFANAITRVALADLNMGHRLIVSAHGARGAPYASLKKGTAPFAAGLAQVQAAYDLAAAAGQSYVVRAVTNVHGESDSEANNPSYAANLVEWQGDYEAAIQAITGQPDPVPMLISQSSSWTRGVGLPSTSVIPNAMRDAHIAAPGKVILVGPKYHLPYAADGVHLSAFGYQQMGEEYAKVYRRVILEGKPWEPVHPISVTRVDEIVSVRMHVPVPPLTFEGLRVTDPGNAGFEWADDGPDTPSIVSVIIVNGETVIVQLSHAPTGGHRRLRYAFSGTPGVPAGPRTGPRGIIRDSDPTLSTSGVPLYDYCVHFEVDAP